MAERSCGRRPAFFGVRVASERTQEGSWEELGGEREKDRGLPAVYRALVVRYRVRYLVRAGLACGWPEEACKGAQRMGRSVGRPVD